MSSSSSASLVPAAAPTFIRGAKLHFNWLIRHSSLLSALRGYRLVAIDFFLVFHFIRVEPQISFFF
jgi:hypothetical protein